jgi:hypothetical protein
MQLIKRLTVLAAMLAIFVAWLFITYWFCLYPVRFIEQQAYSGYVKWMHTWIIFPACASYTSGLAASLILKGGLAIAEYIGDKYTIRVIEKNADQ